MKVKLEYVITAEKIVEVDDKYRVIDCPAEVSWTELTKKPGYYPNIYDDLWKDCISLISDELIDEEDLHCVTSVDTENVIGEI